MDDSNREVGAGPEQLRKALKRNSIRMKRQYDKLTVMLSDIAPGQLDLQELVDAQTLIQSLGAAYEQTYCSLQEAETDPTKGDADDVECELCDRTMTLAKKQCNMLLTLKRVHSARQSVDLSITSLDGGSQTRITPPLPRTLCTTTQEDAGDIQSGSWASLEGSMC